MGQQLRIGESGDGPIPHRPFIWPNAAPSVSMALSQIFL